LEKKKGEIVEHWLGRVLLEKKTIFSICFERLFLLSYNYARWTWRNHYQKPNKKKERKVFTNIRQHNP